jgi:hypothetical protein
MEVSGQLHDPPALPPGKEPPVVKRKIPSPRRESNPRTPMVQFVASLFHGVMISYKKYTDNCTFDFQISPLNWYE